MENKFKFNVYPLSEDDGGGFYAEVPELPGCIASAQTIQETISLLQEAIDSWVKVTNEKGKTVPNTTYYNADDDLPSGRFSVRISRSSHKELLEIAKKENESLNGIVAKFLDVMIAAGSISTIIENKMRTIGAMMEVATRQEDWVWDGNRNKPCSATETGCIYVLEGGKSA